INRGSDLTGCKVVLGRRSSLCVRRVVDRDVVHYGHRRAPEDVVTVRGAYCAPVLPARELVQTSCRVVTVRLMKNEIAARLRDIDRAIPVVELRNRDQTTRVDHVD